MRDYVRSWGSMQITMDHQENRWAGATEGDGTDYTILRNGVVLGTLTALEIEHLSSLLSENMEELRKHNAAYRKTPPKRKQRSQSEIVRNVRALLNELEAYDGETN